VTLLPSLVSFFIAAGLLTLTPGLDTMLVLRTAASEGRTAALLAAAGIQLGCLAWGGAVALGLGALLTASAAAYAALTWCGAAYLVWIGVTLLCAPRRTLEVGAGAVEAAGHDGRRWLWRGFLTNLLNPKVGVFYVSFLPQFVPAGYGPAPFMVGLAVGHVLLASVWLSLLTLGMGRLGPLLRRPAVIGWLDRTTGAVFVAFGMKLALSRAT
jgi:threonine/homoserine/homoserine lactone efflux protein